MLELDDVEGEVVLEIGGRIVVEVVSEAVLDLDGAGVELCDAGVVVVKVIVS